MRMPLFGLLTANAISITGSMMTLVAVPWFVLQTTGSAAKTGLTAAVASLPVIIGSALGGVLVDRIGFRRMSIVADLASGVSVALIPLLYLTVGLAFWQLLVLVFLRGLFDAPGNTARTSMLPDLADMAGTAREQVNAASQAIQRGAALLGPAVAGVLIAIIGASNVLWVDAGSFVASAILVTLAVPRVTTGHAPPAAATEVAAGGLRDGLQFIRQNRLLLGIALCAATSNFADGLLTVAAPVYAKAILGRAVDLGMMFSGLGAGGLIGILLFGRYGRRVSRRALFAAGFIGVACGYGILLVMPGRTVAIAAFVLAGIAAGPINPLLLTVFQDRTPARLRGRVFGLLTSVAWSIIPLGRLAGGYLIEWAGLRAAIGLMAGGYLIAGVAPIIVSVFSNMDKDVRDQQSE
ncbi:MAG: MFS transporter [Armatimonadota bacterium]